MSDGVVVSNWHIVMAWAAVGLTCLLVFVLSKWEKRRRETVEAAQRDFHMKDLLVKLTDPSDSSRVALACALHRSARCRACGVDFSASNAQMPTHHRVFCCVKRKGLPKRCVEIIDRKSGLVVRDTDMINGLATEMETPDRMSRCPLQ